MKIYQVEVIGPCGGKPIWRDMLDVSIPDKTFRMAVGDKMIQGGFDTAISHAHPVQLPQSYRATMNVQEKVVTEDGEDEITYFLLRLDPPEAPPL